MIINNRFTIFVKNPTMEENSQKQYTGLNLKRLEALTDGIFAIAMTILVLAIDVPSSSSGLDGTNLHNAILNQSDQLFAYLMSFILLALFWTINHKQNTYLVRTTGLHVWINIFILAFICLVPYTTSLKSDFPADWMADLYFNANMLIIAMLFLINWSYATKNNRLTNSRFDQKIAKSGKISTLIFILISILASIGSFYIPEESSFIYFLIPAFKFLQHKIEPKIH